MAENGRGMKSGKRTKRETAEKGREMESGKRREEENKIAEKGTKQEKGRKKGGKLWKIIEEEKVLTVEIKIETEKGQEKEIGDGKELTPCTTTQVVKLLFIYYLYSNSHIFIDLMRLFLCL